jgi:antitoxin component YwqK of YwqJK toxin-antitoxin module
MRVFKVIIIFSLIILIILLFVESGLLLKERRIEFSSERPIEWYDFKKLPDFFSRSGASIFTSIEYEKSKDSSAVPIIHSYFYPHKSYFKLGYINSKEVIEHERYHFKITELLARKMQIQVYFSEKNLSDKEIDSIYRTIIKEKNELQMIFDYDTKHGQNLKYQESWYSLIDRFLDDTEAVATCDPDTDTLIKEIDTFYLASPKPTIEYFCSLISGEQNLRLQLEFYKDESIRSELIYRDGKPDGYFLEWFENGEIYKTISYSNGQREGLSCTYDRNGKIIEKYEYSENLLVDN